jgi:hypothetical protein
MLNLKSIFSFFIVVTLIFSNFGKTFSQEIENKNITFRFKNKPLREVLQNLSDQANIKFVYSDELIKGRKVTCVVKDAPISTVMDIILKNTNISFTKIKDENLVSLYKRPQVKNKIEIKGNIIDSQTKLPVEFVNVFLANTTLGDVSDRSGEFIISNIPVGNYELIVSMIGYDIQKKTIQVFSAKSDKLNFELIPKVLPGEEVTVTAEDPKEWKRNLKIFKKIFFGKKEFAKKCELKNPEILNLKYDRNTGQFKAFSEGALVFINKALGYEVTIILDEFYAELFPNDDIYFIEGLMQGNPHTLKKGIKKYLGVCHFNRLIPKNEKQKKEWDKNRLVAYNGSQRHFFKSLVNSKLKEEGFKVCGTKDVSGLNYTTGGDYSLNIYDLLLKGECENVFILSFPDLLKVIYTKEKNEVDFEIGMEMLEARSPYGARYNDIANLRNDNGLQLSLVEMIEGKNIFINSNGIVDYSKSRFDTYGYWFWDSPAESLPYDYQPVKE